MFPCFFFLLPFDYLISNLIKFKLRLEVAAIFIGPIFFVMLLTMLASNFTKELIKNKSAKIWLMYGFVVYVNSYLHSGDMLKATSYVLLGPVFMGIVLLTHLRVNLIKFCIIPFLVGLAVWALIFLALYIYMMVDLPSILPHFAGYSFGEKIIVARAPGVDYNNLYNNYYYYKYILNVNKQSNVILLSMLFVIYLYHEGVFKFVRFLALFIPMALMLLVLFSRGALIVLGVVGFFNVILNLFFLYSKRSSLIGFGGRALVTGFFSLCVVMFSVSSHYLRNYWLDFHSAIERVDILKMTLASSGEKEWLWGYGLDGFPLSTYGDSHNMFFDAWVYGGVIGASIFIIGIFMPICNMLINFKGECFNFWNWYWRLIMLLALIMLGFREFSLNFLTSTSSAAFLMAMVLNTQYLSEHKITNEPNTSKS